MRVLAARFADRRIAASVSEMLQRRLRLDPPDVDIAPLGVPGQPQTTATVLAGRFADEHAAEVFDLILENGGEIVANVDEAWTRPRSAPRKSGMNSALRRERQYA